MTNISMVINTEAKNECLKGLVNAYDNKPFNVRVVCACAANGNFRFMDPNTFSPARWHLTMESLIQKCTYRKGIGGKVNAAGALVCPYTGNQMTIVAEPGFGFRLEGGFDPAIPSNSAETFAYFASMRDGVPSPKFAKPSSKPKQVTVSPVKEEFKVERFRSEPDAAVQEQADKIVHDVKKVSGFKGPVTVAQTYAAVRKRGRPSTKTKK